MSTKPRGARVQEHRKALDNKSGFVNGAPEVILGGLSCPFTGEIKNMNIKSLLRRVKERCVREGAEKTPTEHICV